MEGALAGQRVHRSVVAGRKARSTRAAVRAKWDAATESTERLHARQTICFKYFVKMETVPSVVGAFEAKTKLAELLDRVRQGETFIITKHEKPVARLVGCGQEIKERREHATKALKSLRKRYSLGVLDVRQLKEDGRP